MSKLLVQWDTTMLIHEEHRTVRCFATREGDPQGKLVYDFAMHDLETSEDLTEYAGSPRSILEMGINFLIAAGGAKEIDEADLARARAGIEDDPAPRRPPETD